MVIRDCNGNFMGAASFVFHEVFSPVQIEALAVRARLELVNERGLQNLAFESNSLQIISALNASSMYMSMVGPIIETLKFLRE